jgi:hypothetical protein
VLFKLGLNTSNTRRKSVDYLTLLVGMYMRRHYEVEKAQLNGA